jgi:hypothetical protein
MSPTPNGAPAPLNFKAPRTKQVKDLETSREVLRDYGAQVGATQLATITGHLVDADFIKAFGPEQKAAIASQIAKKRNRIGGKFAPGKVTADEAPKAKKTKPATAADLLAQANTKAKAQEQAAIQAAAAGGGKKPSSGKTGAPSGLTVDTTSPDHLIQAGAAVLEHLRQATPGTDSHAHLLTQYNAMRAAIKTWNQTKGDSASPSSPTVDGGNVKIGPAPGWVPGGAAKLTSPKQFELATLHASTKEEAIELAHYFERYTHNQGVAGDKAWDTAWKEIKAGIKELPAAAKTDQSKHNEGPDTAAKPAPETAQPVDAPEDADTRADTAEPVAEQQEDPAAAREAEPEAEPTSTGPPAPETHPSSPADPIDVDKLLHSSKNPHEFLKKLTHLILQGGAEVRQENLKPKD